MYSVLRKAWAPSAMAPEMNLSFSLALRLSLTCAWPASSFDSWMMGVRSLSETEMSTAGSCQRTRIGG